MSFVRDSKAQTLAERTRWAQALIVAGKHAVERGPELVKELDLEIAELQAKRERLQADVEKGPELVRRGEEELDKIQRVEAYARAQGTEAGASKTKLAKLLDQRERVLARLAELQLEVDAEKALDDQPRT